jgi:SAM-dependent methyltransferase
VKEGLEKQARFFHLGEHYYWFAGQNEIVERILAPVMAGLQARAGGRPLRILDLGCGPGNTLGRLRRWGTVVGADFSIDALRFARTKGIECVFSGDSVAVPLASGSIDCVVALDVLAHVEDDAAALAEIRRVLRPGGAFLFAVPAFMALWRHHDALYGHFRRYSRRGFVARVRAADLVVRECSFFKCAYFVPLWLIAVAERVGLAPRRDNFFALPAWLNRLLHRAIVWEHASGLVRRLPFGVSLWCLGERPARQAAVTRAVDRR